MRHRNIRYEPYRADRLLLAWRPHSAILGRVEGMKGYHDVSRYPDAQRAEGLVLFRWDAPLFFANAEAFREGVEAAVEHAPTPTRWVVVAAEPITDVDMTAADILARTRGSCGHGGTALAWIGDVRRCLR